MEHRQPGPEDTKNANNLHVQRAEGIAAWLHSRRNSEAQQPKNLSEHDDDEDDEKLADKRRRNLKIGVLPISLEERKQRSEDHARENEQIPGDEKSVGPTESGHNVESERLDMPDGVELTSLHEYEEDFRLWEDGLAASSPEAGDAEDMQMAEAQDDAREDDEPYIPQQRTSSTKGAGTHAGSYRYTTNGSSGSLGASSGSTSAKFRGHASPPPAASAGGGGGAVPPKPPAGNMPVGPGNPNSSNNPNTSNVFNSPNAWAPSTAPNVVTSANLNKINNHEHRHGHPRLALAMAAGLVVEHMVGRSADNRIEKASRERDQKLAAQITLNKAVQEQRQQSFEARLSAEQTRQRQEQSAEHIRVNNLERTVAAGRVERVQPPRASETMNTNVDTESLERAMRDSQEMQAEARARSSVIMEQVAAAAESNETVERVYERRQEVKDEPSNPGGNASGGATSVGSVLAKNHGSQQSGAGGRLTHDAHNQGNSSGSMNDQSVDYRAAVIRGVGAGIAIIVLALMAYLIL